MKRFSVAFALAALACFVYLIVESRDESVGRQDGAPKYERLPSGRRGEGVPRSPIRSAPFRQDSLCVQVVGPLGDAIANASVIIDERDPVESDETGWAVIDSVVAGAHELKAVALGFRAHRSAVDGASAGRSIRVELSYDQVISGRVLRCDDAPLTAVLVHLVGPAAGGAFTRNEVGALDLSSDELAVHPDAEGYFEVSRLRPSATYCLDFRHADLVPDPPRSIFVAPNSAPITRYMYPLVGAKVQLLERSSRLAIRLPYSPYCLRFIPESGAPDLRLMQGNYHVAGSLGESRVSALGGTGDGGFVILYLLTENTDASVRGTIEGEIRGLEPVRQPTTLIPLSELLTRPPEDILVDLESEHILCRFEGRWENGEAVHGEGLSLNFFRKEGGELKPAEHGWFEFVQGFSRLVPLRAGRYRLRGGHHVDHLPEIMVSPDQERDGVVRIKLALRRGARLSVLPRGASGHPVTYFTVVELARIDPGHERIRARHHHECRGRAATFAHLAPGAYRCIVRLLSGRIIETEISLQDGEERLWEPDA
jgi:hypothetical protein